MTKSKKLLPLARESDFSDLRRKDYNQKFAIDHVY
tara:strand:- start:115 stop:219 length:105 start_codon:yes stop_codon:yes gene_type:complete